MTKASSVAAASAVLATIALGLSAGALLAEGAVLVPAWRALPPDGFFIWYRDNAARLFDFFGPLEIASTTLAVVAAAVHLLQRRAGGKLLAGAALLSVAILAGFPLYFRDANARFAAATIPADQLAGELARWSSWHWVRTAMGAGAFVVALLGSMQSRNGHRFG